MSDLSGLINSFRSISDWGFIYDQSDWSPRREGAEIKTQFYQKAKAAGYDFNNDDAIDLHEYLSYQLSLVKNLHIAPDNQSNETILQKIKVLQDILGSHTTEDIVENHPEFLKAGIIIRTKISQSKICPVCRVINIYQIRHRHLNECFAGNSYGARSTGKC